MSCVHLLLCFKKDCIKLGGVSEPVKPSQGRELMADPEGLREVKRLRVAKVAESLRALEVQLVQ